MTAICSWLGLCYMKSFSLTLWLKKPNIVGISNWRLGSSQWLYLICFTSQTVIGATLLHQIAVSLKLLCSPDLDTLEQQLYFSVNCFIKAMSVDKHLCDYLFRHFLLTNSFVLYCLKKNGQAFSDLGFLKTNSLLKK